LSTRKKFEKNFLPMRVRGGGKISRGGLWGRCRGKEKGVEK